MSGRKFRMPAVLLVLLAVVLAPGSGRAAGLAAPAEAALALGPEPGESSAFLLTLPARRDADLAVRPAGTLVAAAGSPRKGESSMDFDLLGDAPKLSVPPEDPSRKTRRRMLNWHQGLGIGLYAVQVASTVTGQLNYNDKFGVDNTGKYKATHRGLVYLNLAAFATVGGFALFAPTEKGAPPRPFGRTTIHKIGMALATVGMITQGYLGIRTAQREGYEDKQTYGRAHLAVGYATLAAMSVAVGAIVF